MSDRDHLHNVYLLLTLLWAVALMLAAGPHGAPSTLAGDASTSIVWNPIDDPFGVDKAWHFLLGMGFALPLMLWVETGRIERHKVALVVLGVGLMGVLIEWRQLGAPGRQPSVTDALAFLLGGLIILAVRGMVLRSDRRAAHAGAD